jgi:hypothetical protein
MKTVLTRKKRCSLLAEKLICNIESFKKLNPNNLSSRTLLLHYYHLPNAIKYQTKKEGEAA